MHSVRNSLNQRRQQLSKDEFHHASREVSSRLLDLIKSLNLNTVALYFSKNNEIDVSAIVPILEQIHCNFFAPKAEGKSPITYSVAPYAGPFGTQTHSGPFGIMEPTSNSIDLPHAKTLIEGWIVPGVGFTELGHRIGFGRGFYDRLLAGTMGLKIGVAYDWQVVPSLPQHPHDVPMDFLITPSRTIRCQRSLI